MQNRQKQFLREAAATAIMLLAVLATEYLFFGLAQMRWDVPLLYIGDGINWVAEVGDSLHGLSERLGWPLHTAPSPYEPNYDLIFDAFVWFCGLFTRNTATVFNLYLLAIPFANALGGYAALRLAGVRRWLSASVGLIFALSPYVQQRVFGGHAMLGAIQFVLFSLLFCLWCAEDPAFNRPGRGFFKYPRNWLALGITWGIANNGAAYYPYFTCFLLCVTALCLLLRDKKAASMTSCFVTIGEIVLWMIPDFFPMVLGKLAGVGSVITNGAYRSPIGGDIYSLRISSLLLSPNGYGWDKLARWIQRYFQLLGTDEGPMYNENGIGYLTILGVLGFLGLLVLLFRNHSWQAGRTAGGEPRLEDRLWLLAKLNVAMLLFSTIAGFGALISILLRIIRCYNRISPYILAAALLAAALLAEELLRRLRGRRKAVLAAALACLLAYTYWEQQGLVTLNYEQVQTCWDQDEAFLTEVEEKAGENAVIFQLPYMKTFENGPVYAMTDYALYRGVLHSDTLRFSYGAGYGTDNDLWYEATATLDPAAMVAELREQGVAGIYLDLDGYPEEDRQPVVEELCREAGDGDPLYDASGRLCYIALD